MSGFWKASTITILAVVLPAISWAFTGQVVGVSDGDTITVLEGKTQHKVRLFGLDCPESHQAFGTRAKQFTLDMVFARTVDVEEVTNDQYGRTVGIVRVEGKIVNEELIREGFAWVYQRYCRRASCQAWAELEAIARRENRGLWADKIPVPPWEFRNKKKRSR